MGQLKQAQQQGKVSILNYSYAFKATPGLNCAVSRRLQPCCDTAWTDGSTQVCKKKKKPHELTSRSVLCTNAIQIPVSILYFICLFYCFINWTPEAPIFPASSVYAAVQAQSQIQNFKKQKKIYQKNSKLHAKYKVSVLFTALLYFLFKTSF